MDRHQVTAWVNEPGIYGLIGLPKHTGLLETLRLFDRLGPQLLEERERDEHGLHDRICGLILCADPTPWGEGPIGPGDICQKCLGLDPVFPGRLPEKWLLERLPDRPPILREIDDDDDGAAGQAALLSWGSNYFGQLGDGSSRNQRDTPVWAIPRLIPKKVVGPATGDWTLALATDGSVWAWGSNGSGVFGNGTFVTESSIPVRVAFLTDVVDIAAGSNHGVAVKSDGSVWSWGLRDWHQSNPDRFPVRVMGLSDIVAVAAGDLTPGASGRRARLRLGRGQFRTARRWITGVPGKPRASGGSDGGPRDRRWWFSVVRDQIQRRRGCLGHRPYRSCGN